MDCSIGIQKHAIMSWRDRQIIGAYELFNGKAIEARNAFERQLSEATLLDSAWNPAGFADRRIDALLANLLRVPLKDFFCAAGAELVTLDDRLSELGSVLADEQQIEMPAEQEPNGAAQAGEKAEAAEQEAKKKWLKRAAGAVSRRATSAAAFASETADWFIQDKVGLRNRLRYAAATRIANIWMGDIGEPAPVLAQVIRAIEVAANEARIKLS